MTRGETYLNAHEKDFADQDDNCVVVGALLKTAVSEDVLLNYWEEHFDQLV